MFVRVPGKNREFILDTGKLVNILSKIPSNSENAKLLRDLSRYIGINAELVIVGQDSLLERYGFAYQFKS